MAVSNSDRSFTDGYALAAKFIAENLDALTAVRMPDYTALNINYPACKHTGVSVVPVGKNRYSDMFAEVGENMLKISGEPLGEETDNNTDVSQIARGHITVSPVTLDMNDYALLARLKEEFPL